MTTTYEAAVTVVEQLSPVDHVRLVALLAQRLQHTLQTEPSLAEGADPAFWHLLVNDAAWNQKLHAELCGRQLFLRRWKPRRW
jgi:hypothetical protein